MAADGHTVGVRPRWPDLVIVLSIVALVAVGVVTLFGASIRAWFEPTAPPPATQPRLTPPGSAAL